MSALTRIFELKINHRPIYDIFDCLLDHKKAFFVFYLRIYNISFKTYVNISWFQVASIAILPLATFKIESLRECNGKPPNPSLCIYMAKINGLACVIYSLLIFNLSAFYFILKQIKRIFIIKKLILVCAFSLSLIITVSRLIENIHCEKLEYLLVTVSIFNLIQ